MNEPETERPTEDFVCVWCEIAEVETVHPPDEFGGWCAETNKPICDNCADAAKEEIYAESK